jgi:hypothetical protein
MREADFAFAWGLLTGAAATVAALVVLAQHYGAHVCYFG